MRWALPKTYSSLASAEHRHPYRFWLVAVQLVMSHVESLLFDVNAHAENVVPKPEGRENV